MYSDSPKERAFYEADTLRCMTAAGVSFEPRNEAFHSQPPAFYCGKQKLGKEPITFHYVVELMLELDRKRRMNELMFPC